MRGRFLVGLLIAVVMFFGLVTLACGLSGRFDPQESQPAATAPVVAPEPTRGVVVFTPTPQPAAPDAPAGSPTPEWPQTLVIGEADIEQQAANNAVPGLTVSGLDVQFQNDTMVVNFASLQYSIISLRNVTVQGYFEVANGDVNFVADRIDPNNLATQMIPDFINQALDQQLGAWYVETIRLEPGQLVAQVRPR